MSTLFGLNKLFGTIDSDTDAVVVHEGGTTDNQTWLKSLHTRSRNAFDATARLMNSKGPDYDGLEAAIRRRPAHAGVPLSAPSRDTREDIIEGIFRDMDALLADEESEINVNAVAQPFVAGAEQSMRIFQAVDHVLNK